MVQIITLITDFGLEDEYVGVMKGVILSRAPDTTIIDLTHNIGPQDLYRAAHVIHGTYHYFPAGTIHLVVVDPGVGGSRKIILVQADHHFFLAPDNGVLSLFFDESVKIREITNHSLFLSPLSHTFHGRDIFAPVGAALASGLSPDKIGPLCELSQVTRLQLPEVRIGKTEIKGQIISIDHFGNLITNIHRSMIPEKNRKNSAGLRLTIGNQELQVVSSYSQMAQGESLALFGSRDYLEIAINKGNAAKELKKSVNEQIIVSFA